MECENEDETAWTRQIWHSEIVKVTLLHYNYSIVTFNLFSLPNMWVQVVSTMDQRWINDVSLAPQLPPLAAPYDPLLELAPPLLRKKYRDKWTETEKHRNNHRNRETKSYKTKGVHYWVLTRHVFFGKLMSFVMFFLENWGRLSRLAGGVIWCVIEQLFWKKLSMKKNTPKYPEIHSLMRY